MSAMESAEDAGDVAAMISANYDFHFTIFDAAGRPRMVEIIRLLWQSTDAYRTLYYTEAAARRREHDEHTDIMDRLRAGRVADAIRLLDEHRQHAVADLSSRFNVAT
jgi:DNA-binding GntR family transcriptional regulator